MTKTIAIECTVFINNDVHFGNMEVRDADEEHCYTDDGEEICCPICGTAWLTGIEGEFSLDNCEHLRFSLNAADASSLGKRSRWDRSACLTQLSNLAQHSSNFEKSLCS